MEETNHENWRVKKPCEKCPWITGDLGVLWMEQTHAKTMAKNETFCCHETVKSLGGSSLRQTCAGFLRFCKEHGKMPDSVQICYRLEKLLRAKEEDKVNA